MALRLLVVAVFGLAAVSFQFVVRPNWPDARSDQWAATAALAAVAVAITTYVGLAALGLLWQQSERARRQQRIEFGPYLRVDLSPDLEYGTFTPRSVPEGSSFDFADLNPLRDEPASPLDEWRDADGVKIYVWVQNQQTHPGGTAHNVDLHIELEMPRSRSDQETLTGEYHLRLHYLEPQQAVRYELTTVAPAIPFMAGRVRSIGYNDMYGTPLTFCHGSMKFAWLGSSLVNDRVVIRD